MISGHNVSTTTQTPSRQPPRKSRARHVNTNKMGMLKNIVKDQQNDVMYNRNLSHIDGASRWTDQRKGYTAHVEDYGNTGHKNVIIRNPHNETVAIDGWKLRNYSLHPERSTLAKHNFHNPNERRTMRHLRELALEDQALEFDTQTNQFNFTNRNIADHLLPGVQAIQSRKKSFRPQRVFQNLILS